MSRARVSQKDLSVSSKREGAQICEIHESKVIGTPVPSSQYLNMPIFKNQNSTEGLMFEELSSIMKNDPSSELYTEGIGAVSSEASPRYMMQNIITTIEQSCSSQLGSNYYKDNSIPVRITPLLQETNINTLLPNSGNPNQLKSKPSSPIISNTKEDCFKGNQYWAKQVKLHNKRSQILRVGGFQRQSHQQKCTYTSENGELPTAQTTITHFKQKPTVAMPSSIFSQPRSGNRNSFVIDEKENKGYLHLKNEFLDTKWTDCPITFENSNKQPSHKTPNHFLTKTHNFKGPIVPLAVQSIDIPNSLSRTPSQANSKKLNQGAYAALQRIKQSRPSSAQSISSSGSSSNSKNSLKTLYQTVDLQSNRVGLIPPSSSKQGNKMMKGNNAQQGFSSQASSRKNNSEFQHSLSGSKNQHNYDLRGCSRVRSRSSLGDLFSIPPPIKVEQSNHAISTNSPTQIGTGQPQIDSIEKDRRLIDAKKQEILSLRHLINTFDEEELKINHKFNEISSNRFFQQTQNQSRRGSRRDERISCRSSASNRQPSSSALSSQRVSLSPPKSIQSHRQSLQNSPLLQQDKGLLKLNIPSQEMLTPQNIFQDSGLFNNQTALLSTGLPSMMQELKGDQVYLQAVTLFTSCYLMSKQAASKQNTTRSDPLQ